MPIDPHRPDGLLFQRAATTMSWPVRRIFSGVLAVVFFASSLAAQSETGLLEEKLVPGALGVRTDGKGNTWNLEPDGSIGRVGSTMVNTGLALEVNGEKFEAYQPMMTEDGEVVVIQGRPIDTLPGLQVQRRIRILPEEGGLRYAEMFFNGSTDKLSLNIALVTNFSGNYKSFMTDRGRTEPVLLGAEEEGILVLPGATQSTRAFLFSLSGKESVLKPTISARNGYVITFQYALTLEPGETGILLHQVAQTVIPQSFERRRLLSLFLPHGLDSAAAGLPEQWVSYLKNVRDLDVTDRFVFQPQSGIEALGVEPASKDMLVFDEETRLPGKVEGEMLQLDTVFGKLALDLEALSGLQGEGGDGTVRAIFQNGEVFRGQLSADRLELISAGGGDAIVIDPATLDRVVLARKEPVSLWSDGIEAIIETYLGEKIAVEKGGVLKFATAWGVIETPLDQVLWVGPHTQSAGVKEMMLRNGSRVIGKFFEGSFDVSLSRLGISSLDTSLIKAIFTPRLEDVSMLEASMIEDASVHLRGAQILTGKPLDLKLRVQTGGTDIDTEFNQIRSVSTALDSNKGSGKKIRIERWDGGIVSGLPLQDTVTFQVGGSAVWRLPLRDVKRIETSSPQFTEEFKEEVEQRIRLLGSDSWEERENASTELGAFGYLAAPLLQKHLAASSDPEVKRRLERILAELN